MAVACWLMRKLILAADDGFKLNTNSNKFTPPPNKSLIYFPRHSISSPSFLYQLCLQPSN